MNHLALIGTPELETAAGRHTASVPIAGLDGRVHQVRAALLGSRYKSVAEIAVGGPSIPLYFTYDALSRRTRMDAGVQMMGMADLRNDYYYDALDRLTRVDQNKGTGSYATIAEKRVDFSYNAAGQFTTITRYKDLDGGSTHLVATSSYEYDLIGRLTGLTHAKVVAGSPDPVNIADYDWAYDAHSRVTSQSRTHLVGGTQSTNYNYDNTGQLTGADNSTQTDESYSYDAAGNRDMSGYTTGDNNRMTSDGTFNYTYDNEGNRLTRTRISSASANDYLTEYTWDHRNRLTKVTFKNNSGSVTKWVEFDYDPFDRRVEKRLDADGSGPGAVVKTFYVYDPGNDPVYGGKGVLDLQGRPLTQVLFEYNGSNQITHRYLYGPGVDFILADEAVGDEVLWALADNQGTVRDVIDGAGNVEDHIEYNSFGLMLSHTDPAQRFLLGYAGYVWDPDTGAYNARLRWYDASTGKWLSEDPIGFNGGDYNISRYVGNGPNNKFDPSGLEEQKNSGTRFKDPNDVLFDPRALGRLGTPDLNGDYYDSEGRKFLSQPNLAAFFSRPLQSPVASMASANGVLKILQEKFVEAVSKAPVDRAHDATVPINTYNCAGMAFRDYTIWAKWEVEKMLKEAQEIGLNDKVGFRELKVIYYDITGWDHYLHGEYSHTQSTSDYHVVAMEGNGENAISKNGDGPVTGPGRIDCFPPEPSNPEVLSAGVTVRPRFSTRIYKISTDKAKKPRR